MKQGGGIFILVILFLSVVNVCAIEDGKEAIDKRLVADARENEKVEVIVKIDGNEEKQERMKKIVGKEDINFNFSSFDGFSAEVSEKELNLLKKESNVTLIPIGKKKLFLINATNLINASISWAIQTRNENLTGLGETVCVIDTGVNSSHADLAGRVIAEKCYCSRTGADCCPDGTAEDDDAEDTNGHGTHVSGIIAANGVVRGAAPGVKLAVVKVFGEDDVAYDDDIIAAIDWCVSNSVSYNISVISMSLGGLALYSSYCDSQILETAYASSINNAVANNISVIVASGNDASTTGIASPACIQNSTSVADVYSANWGGLTWVGTCTDATTSADKLVCHANRNYLIDLLAPGALITSTWKTGGYYQAGGTSMAAPMVAGAFAIVRQFKKKETGVILTPLQIQNVLNSTGKRIFDSGSGLTFSRINIYDAIINLTAASPNVTLVLPLNNTRTNREINFTCSASSNYNLTNMSFFIWNSTSLVYNSTRNVSGVANSSIFNYSFSVENNYLWNCQAYNNLSSFSYAPNNFSTVYDVSKPVLNFNIRNNSWINGERYSVVVDEGGDLCLFSTDNTANKTMTKFNSTYFNYTDLSLTEGMHNVSFFCNDSAGNFNASSLIWFNVEKIAPNISLISPAEGYSETASSTTILFEYNVTDSINLSFCRVIVGENIGYNLSEITNSINNISLVLSPGSYSWSVNCTDEAGNEGNSSSRSFVISAPVVAVSSGGGGGGGGSASASAIAFKVYTPSSEQLGSSGGYVRDVAKKDKIKLMIDLEEHTIEVINISLTNVLINISSKPQQSWLYIGEEKKFNLDEDNYYDLYIKLNSITNLRANFTLKEINQTIILGNLDRKEVEENQASGITPITTRVSWINRIAVYVVSGLIVILTALALYYIWKKEKSRK